MLSVIIITRNEEQKIRDCLDSVAWADEIIVVDSGSTDATTNICREYTDKVFYQEWKGFGPQKNHALGLASHEWILSLDADERVTEPLKQEIIEALGESRSSLFCAYDLPRRSRFCGRYMKYCGWYPDYVLRLFRKENSKFTDDLVHERVVTDGKKGVFKHPILHLSVDSLDQAIEKMNLYSTVAAKEKFERGESASLLKAILRGGWTFFRVYLLKLGFLDGRQGFMLSIANAGGTYYKYAKLAEFGLRVKGA